MTYNPDGDPGAFDYDDPESVRQYLDDPGNTQMWESLERQFRELRGTEQIPELAKSLTRDISARDDLRCVIAEQAVPGTDPRRELLAKLEESVERHIRRRIAELAGIDL